MKKILLAAFLMIGLSVLGFAYAQIDYNKNVVVNYEGQEPMDSDLDGLTDQGELQIYKTDPKNSNSDDDSDGDAVEVLSGSNPLDKNSDPESVFNASFNSSVQKETPWAWYVSRASGLIAFLLLCISIFLGLTLRIPFMRKFFAPIYALNAHCWISLHAIIFAFIHGLVLIFDKFMSFSVLDVFIPFKSSFKTGLVTLGILSFYTMVILVATSYGRKLISQQMWRAVHFLNIGLYVIVVIHAYYLGTDMKNEIVRNIFVYANSFLVFMMLVNMFLRIKEKNSRKNAISSSENQNLN